MRQNVYIDIDNTICATCGMNYTDSVPIQLNIDKVNKMYDSGNYIITYWTARGVKTGINWTKLTEKQLNRWGVKYHYLKLDKPPYDIFIDDKSINSLWDWTDKSVNKILK